MIREARPSDMNRLLFLAKQFLEPSSFTFDPVAISQSISDHIQDKNKCVFVAEKGEKVLGVVGGVKNPNLWGLVVASESLLFVDPEHRGRAGLELIKAFETWARPHPVVITTRLDFHKDDRLNQLLMRKGYKAIETNYIRY